MVVRVEFSHATLDGGYRIEGGSLVSFLGQVSGRKVIGSMSYQPAKLSRRERVRAGEGRERG